MVTSSPNEDDGVAGQPGAPPPAQPIPPASSSLLSPSQQPTLSSSLPLPPLHSQFEPHINFSIPELKDGSLFDMIRYLSVLPPDAAPAAPLVQPAIPPPPEMQPTMQPQHCNYQPPVMLTMQGSQYHGYLGATQVQHTAQYAVPPDTPVPPAGPAIGRRRGRPPRSTAKSPKPKPKPKLVKTAAAASAGELTAATSEKEWPTSEHPSATAFATVARRGEEAVDAVSNEAGQEVVEYADTSPPGVRFKPTDVEMIDYLKWKYLDSRMPVDFIKEFNIFKDHPSTIQGKCGDSIDGAWYVFSPRHRKYRNGFRPTRSVGAVGYWKSNNKEADIEFNKIKIGNVNSLTFMLGRQPKGTPTRWKMREYHIKDCQLAPNPSSMLLDQWAICKLFHADGEDQDDVPVQDQMDEGGEHVDVANGNEGEDNIDGNQPPNDPEHELDIDDYLALDDFAHGDPADQ